MIRLVLSAKDESRVVETADRVVTIGRGTESTLQIHDDGASRKHCAIEQLADGSYRLTDLASRNGTRLNGERVTESALKAGDVILIGATTIAVEGFAAGVAAPAPPPPPAAPAAPAAAAAQGSIKLVFTAGPNKGQAFDVTKDVTTLGRRRRDNDIALVDSGISNRHAQVRRGPEGFVLADLGSKNGTFLNGHRIQQPSPLKPGDHIQFGHSVIEVRGPHPTTATTAHIPKPSPAELAPPGAKPPAPETPKAPAQAAPEPPRPPAPAGPEPAPQAPAPKAPSRRRVLILGVAIAVAVSFFAAVLVARSLGRRKPAPVPTEKQPGESPEPKKATTSAPARPTTGAQAPATPQKKEPAADESAAEKRQRAELDAALKGVRRAELTAEADDFDAAQKALEGLGASLKGTPYEREAAKALAGLPAARQAAADRRRDAEAAALLAAAKRHQESKEPNIARLHCRELLDRFPNSQAAAEARALLAALNAPVPAPPEK